MHSQFCIGDYFLNLKKYFFKFNVFIVIIELPKKMSDL